MPGLRFDNKLSLELTMPSTVPRDGASLHLYPGTSCLATIVLSLRDKNHSPIEETRIKSALMVETPGLRAGVLSIQSTK